MFIRNVELKPILSTHKDFLLKAYNQQAVIETGFITYDYPMSDVRVESIINNWLSESDFYKCFIIESNDEPIGTAQIMNINYVNRTCELGVLFIEEYQGAGAALSAFLQLLEIAFDHMDFYKVIIRVQEINPVLLKGAKSMGFTHEGTLREQVRHKGGRTDLHFYGITQEEYLTFDYSRYERFLNGRDKVKVGQNV